MRTFFAVSYSKTALGGFSRLLCKIFVLKVLPSFVKCLDVNAMVSAKQCRFVDSKHLKDSSLVKPACCTVALQKNPFEMMGVKG